jgi:hypothetical protein
MGIKYLYLGFLDFGKLAEESKIEKESNLTDLTNTKKKTLVTYVCDLAKKTVLIK